MNKCLIINIKYQKNKKTQQILVSWMIEKLFLKTLKVLFFFFLQRPSV